MSKNRPLHTSSPTVALAPGDEQTTEVVEIRGARQNNLKGIDLDLPLGRLNVITGPSGSGKSSLAFDTIYAEGQRRYVETFSPYTRQFLDRMDKPKVDAIHGIPPAIAIEQSNQVKSTRSTVGTITEINDYLKLLMPRVAQAFCPSCHSPIRPDSARGIAEQTLARCAGSARLVTFAVPVPVGAVPAEFFAFLQAQGYLRVWLDSEVIRTDEAPSDLKRLPLRVHVIQDRVTVGAESRSRLTESIETALRFGKSKIRLIDPANGEEECFSTGWHCPRCDIDIKPPTPGLFSFNNPVGACPKCRGFGRTIGIDLDRALPNKRLSIAQGVVKPFQSGQSADCQRDLLRAAARQEIDINVPFEDLPKADQKFVIQGEGGTHADGEELWAAGGWYGIKGYFDWLETKTYKMHVRVLLSRYRAYTICPDCDGGRFQPATLNYRLVPGAEWAPAAKRYSLLPGFNLPELAQLPVTELEPVMAALTLPPNDPSAEMLQKEIVTRLRYLLAVGLGYLNLDRPTRTLSGGEIERVNLTTCLGASLVNTLFVLDEPSVGLHPRDVGRLIRVMEDLRDKGNTLLVVEHEEAVIRAADNLIDIGPGRGEAGGELVFSGPLPELGRCPGSLTADYLTGRKSIPLPARRRPVSRWLKIKGAREHNLRKVDVDLPLGVFACITGVSGSGKSTLIHDVLYQNLLRQRGLSSDESVGRCDEITGADQLSTVVMVDQTPLSKTPRSNPVVYLGVFDAVRELFATSDEARATGLSAGAFSFNSGDGRCERCSGIGFEKIEMQFLSDLYVRCTECEGKRFQPHVLKVRYHGKNIHEVLEMTVAEAIVFLESRHGLKGVPAMLRMPLAALRILNEVGLGYLRLGQPLNTLSGGEAQRLKLVGHLVERERNPDAKGAMLIFDEPTTGLHFDDVALLVRVFQRLVEQGDSLLVIEHNLEVIKCADYLVDLGPEAGTDGGLLVAVGTPEEVARVEASHTGYYVRPLLEGARNEKMLSVDGVAVEQAANVGNGHRPSVVRGVEMPSRETNGHHAPKAAPAIRIKGAREHNLKNLTLDLPRGRMVIVTGLSGSGKSTLAFDILFAEGQRRFLDSMSPYARQFVEQLEKPDVDLIEGLPPSVAIEQRVTRGGGKSTVATVTEVYHFLRLLFAKLGTQYCPKCQVPVEKQSQAAIVKQVEDAAKKGRVRVLAPLIKARKGFHTDVAAWAVKHGFDELWVDGKFCSAHGFQKLERFREHTIDVVVGEVGGAKKKAGAVDRVAAILTKGRKLKNAAVSDDPREIVKRALDIGKGTARLVDAKGKSVVLSTEMSCPECGEAFEELDPRLFSYNSPHGWCPECRGFGIVWKGRLIKDDDSASAAEQELAEERATQWLDEDDSKPCPECNGGRLNAVARNVRVRNLTIDAFAALPVSGARTAAEKFKFKGTQALIAADIVDEIRQRLTFMEEVGLGYLALDRSAKTLSGGETQRIRLSAQLGSNLRGVLYVLDEPTIGLHPRDNNRLLDTLVALKGKGNSLVIVEHDDETMRRADYIVDLGPGPGVHGGEVVAQGTLPEIQANPLSVTGRCLKDPIKHPMNGERRPVKSSERWIELKGASANNLQKVDLRFPVGRLSVITGISGSGKSSLMRSVLLPAAQQALAKTGKTAKAAEIRKQARKQTPTWTAFNGVDHLEAVYEVDQSPIGKTSRSTPATYVGVLDEIRALFAQLPLSRIRGYTNSRFSFNNEGGRCESCQGQGVIRHEMSFLPTSYVPCEDCGGLRYNPQTLEVLYNDLNIGQVLNLTIEQASEFFAAISKIHRPLSLLTETGLGYLKLGQPSPTLSGGEAQRLKLVTELTRGVGAAQHKKLRQARATKSTLYLLEEPTVGLHMADVEQLLKVLHRLVDEGNTVVVIEHHLSVIAEADYLVDIGPEAGEDGGKLVGTGTPEQIAKHKVSRIAPFLRELLGA